MSDEPERLQDMAVKSQTRLPRLRLGRRARETVPGLPAKTGREIYAFLNRTSG